MLLDRGILKAESAVWCSLFDLGRILGGDNKVTGWL